MRICVVVASLGRPRQVLSLLERLETQAKRPERVIISVERPDDVPEHSFPHVDVIYGPRGASAQRNRGIDFAMPDCDLIVFFDDDYVPSKFFLRNAARMFIENRDIAGATGLVLADGVSAGGIDMADACAIVQRHDEDNGDTPLEIVDVPYAYGCNMVFRTTSIANVRFDENLPLYSWQEDVDFAARTLRHGRVVKTNAFVGVHLGVTSSRTSGVRFGYSQIVNPIYLLKKGTMRPSHVARLIAKNLVANHVKALRSESHIDRLGRVRGNWMGIVDCAIGKADPRRILTL